MQLPIDAAFADLSPGEDGNQSFVLESTLRVGSADDSDSDSDCMAGSGMHVPRLVAPCFTFSVPSYMDVSAAGQGVISTTLVVSSSSYEVMKGQRMLQPGTAMAYSPARASSTGSRSQANHLAAEELRHLESNGSSVPNTPSAAASLV